MDVVSCDVRQWTVLIPILPIVFNLTQRIKLDIRGGWLRRS